MELRLLWDIFRDRVWILVVTVAAAILIALGIFVVSPTIYEGNATIQIKRVSESASALSLIPTSSTELNFIDKDNVVGSIDVFMRNDALIQRVMEKCGITTNEFDRSPAKFADPGMISILFRERGVQIEAEKDSEVFTITGMAPDLDEAQKIANTFSEEFFAYYRDLKFEELRRVRSVYLERIEAIDKIVRDMDAEELAHRKLTGLASFETQRSNILTQMKQVEDDLATDRNTLAKVLTEKTASHPDVVILFASIADYEKRWADLKAAMDRILEQENERVEIVRHRDNLDAESASFDNAIRTIDAILNQDMKHFIVLGPAVVPPGADTDDYVFMPNKGLILIVMLILGVMGGVILIFLVEYGNESPRLYASFEQLAGDTRTISVRGRRGWTLILAELGRTKPGARIAILQRGGRRTHRFPAKLKRMAARGGAVHWTQVTTKGPSRGADKAVQPDALASTLASTASTAGGSLSLYSFTGLTDSPDGYLHASSFDFVIYVARSGLANIEDIRADLRYLRAHGMADRMIGVFYDC